MILDEAMGQMDGFKKREIILPRLFEFVKQHNMTLILISHDAVRTLASFLSLHLLNPARI